MVVPVIATQAVCQAWSHAIKIPAFLSIGFDYLPHTKLLAVMLACVVAGTFTGKWLLDKVSRELFLRALELILGAIALQLIAKAF